MEAGFDLKQSTLGIIGLGLMGGSLAMRLKDKCARLIGFDSHLPTLELALSKKVVDQAESDCATLLSQIDLLILAMPVQSILGFIHQLPLLASHPCIVMDIGSTKREILNAMSTLPQNFDPIGGHPICGREKLGLENADPNLYENASFVVIPCERTGHRARSAAEQIISAIGSNLLEMSAQDHDRMLSSTSHLPFLISSALANSTSSSFASLIGPGFRSTSRLAGTPSHMMMGILKSNRDHVLAAIQAFRHSLDEIGTALQDENYSQLELLLDQSRVAYQALTEN